MRIHHLNCGNILGLHYCGESLLCHCLLIETPKDGLVLVDTGLGAQDLVNPVPRLGLAFSYIYARPERNVMLAAISQIRKMGFSPKDVRNIVLTHLDLDHVGGLVDFPDARVHVHKLEHDIAMTRPTLQTRHRYMPSMWDHGPLFKTYDEEGEPWKGFGAIRQLSGLPPEILLIPTAGHTRGHTAVAVETNDGWLLHAGDAYFDYKEVHQKERECSYLLESFQFINQTNKKERLFNQERLRQLALNNSDVKVFCAHNPLEFQLMKGIEYNF